MVVDKLSELQGYIRQMIATAGSGHYASSMSALEIMFPLFYGEGIKPDQFILSKGHAAPALYAILYDLGYIDSFDNFRQFGGLPGHPSIETNGVLCSSGSLGMGISKAVGLAHVNKDKVYHVLIGDGELQEGSNWEALHYINHNKIHMHIWVDCNNKQYSGDLCTTLPCWVLEKANEYFGNHIHFKFTTWQQDNHYLTIPKDNPKVKKYSEQLQKLMSVDNRVICLNADLEHDFGLTPIKERFPDRYIQCGIAEQHMVSMAGGLARAGMLPFCHTFGAFYRRALDQIYNNCCDNLPIVYVAGLCGEFDVNIGKSHEQYSTDFYSILPNIEVTNKFMAVKHSLGTRSYYLEIK